MHVAAKVFRASQFELKRAHWEAAMEAGPFMHSFIYAGRRLDARIVRAGLAIELRFDEAIIDVLRVKHGELVDGAGVRVAELEAFFGFLVLEFVTPVSCSMPN